MHGYENVHGAIEKNMKMKFKNELKKRISYFGIEHHRRLNLTFFVCKTLSTKFISYLAEFGRFPRLI